MKSDLIKYGVIIFMSLFIQACGTQKKVPEHTSPQPSWIKSRPVTPGYYTGIGWARKNSNIHQYQQAAKQNALSDLASEISVNISSNSVLHAFESNLGFREDFSSTIQARTQEELEGFELSDTWEDQDNYWVYYSLSASRYNEIKESRKNDAATLAAGHLGNALESREQGDIRMSLVYFINSMTAIKDYLNDPLPYELDGKTVQLGNEIFSEMSYTISQLEISPFKREIEVKTGQEVLPSSLKFKITYHSGIAAPDFPLLANYSGRPIRNNRIRTGRDGTAGFGIERVRSSGNAETLTVKADMESIISEATTDPVIRRLVGRFSVPESGMRINIIKPVIALDIKEELMGVELSGGTIGDSFKKNAVDAGYILDNNSDKPDYVVRITAGTYSAGDSGSYKNVILEGSIFVEAQNGNMIYHRELDGFKGSHFDFDRAGEEAYRQAIRRMNSTYFREIDEVLKSGAGFNNQ